MSDTELNVKGGPAASRLGQYSWGFYDWANQPYFTIVGTAVFGPYFVRDFIGDPVLGQEIYGYIIAIAGIGVALLSPVLGAIADAAGRRKPWIFVLSIVFVIALASLWYSPPGAPNGIFTVALGLIVASITMELCVVFNNSMLPDVAPANRIGTLSGFGFGIGYVGGFIALAILLLAFSLPATSDIAFLPDAPLFGLDPEQGEHDRIVAPFSALWYIIFAVPFFLFTPDRARRGRSASAAVREGLGQLLQTIIKARNYKNILLFLLARMTYADGLSAMFSFGGIYAAGIFGWSGTTTGLFVLILIVFATVGAFVGGWLDDKIGSKPTLYIALAFLLVGVTGSMSITSDTILFFVPAVGVDPGAPLQSVPELTYLLFGILIGFGSGPTSAASRSLMSRLSPNGMETEFFGLYALSGKATAFIAPLMIAIFTGMFHSQRAGMLVIIVMIVSGFLLLIPVRMQKAKALH